MAAILHARDCAEEARTLLIEPLHLIVGCVLADGNVREYFAQNGSLEIVEVELKKRVLESAYYDYRPDEVELSTRSWWAISCAHFVAKGRPLLRRRSAGEIPVQTEDLFCGALYADTTTSHLFQGLGRDVSDFAIIASAFPAERCSK